MSQVQILSPRPFSKVWSASHPGRKNQTQARGYGRPILYISSYGIPFAVPMTALIWRSGRMDSSILAKGILSSVLGIALVGLTVVLIASLL